MHKHENSNHSHGTGVNLTAEQTAILQNGYRALKQNSTGLALRDMPSKRYPTPLALAVYGEVLSTPNIIERIDEKVENDAVSVLEEMLVLMEVYATNQTENDNYFPDDMAFLGQTFSSKRLNGWCHILGGTAAAREKVEQAIKAKWNFRFFEGITPYHPANIYGLLERLTRYAFAYGRCKLGDVHELGHFIEDHTPGVLVCLPGMSDLELTLSLAAMKIGVPAVVFDDYPFPLGRTLRVKTVEDILDAVVGFANIRKLLSHPNLPEFPEFCLTCRPDKPPVIYTKYGEHADSFYLFAKSATAAGQVRVVGDLASFASETPLGFLVEANAEPLDAIDRAYIEKSIIGNLWRLPNTTVTLTKGKLVIGVEKNISLNLTQIADVLRISVMALFPKIKHVDVTVFIGDEVARKQQWIKEEKIKRQKEIEATNEDTINTFYGCVGCSPFAPDHACVLTPDRVPQCSRAFGEIKTGALYGYDDMSNIHHSKLHRDINSFLVVEKGECLDSVTGEWSGINRYAQKMTGGRTKRIWLHSLAETPTTGCGCFSIILFKLADGIGIMHRGWKGEAPDGRTWEELHYALAGKQTPGIAGTAAGYLRSPKFMQADGGWNSVVWMTSKIAKIAGNRVTDKVTVVE